MLNINKLLDYKKDIEDSGIVTLDVALSIEQEYKGIFEEELTGDIKDYFTEKGDKTYSVEVIDSIDGYVSSYQVNMSSNVKEFNDEINSDGFLDKLAYLSNIGNIKRLYSKDEVTLEVKYITDVSISKLLDINNFSIPYLNVDGAMEEMSAYLTDAIFNKSDLSVSVDCMSNANEIKQLVEDHYEYITSLNLTEG